MTIDTNAYLSRWPFRRLAGDAPSAFVSHMREQGVSEAWVGSFDGLLHRDVGAVNARLAADCKNFGNGMLVPFGTINPKLPDWQEDLRRCRELYGMPNFGAKRRGRGWAANRSFKVPNSDGPYETAGVRRRRAGTSLT